MRLCVIVPFLNEEQYLPRVLDSIGAQSRPADMVLLVDDGSTDCSLEVAEGFAAEHAARVMRRPPRSQEKDRLTAAAEYQAFWWAYDQLEDGFDVVAKLDADIELTPEVFATIERRFKTEPDLGVAGCFTTELHAGRWRREPHPTDHVRGGTKYYRVTCLEQMRPIPAILGWDTIDDTGARMRGWRTESFEIPSGDPRHLRPTGMADGLLRAHRRWGKCAWGYGASLPYAITWGLVRSVRAPHVGGAHFIAGYLSAALHRAPRADRRLRRHTRREGRARIVHLASAVACDPRTLLARAR